MRKYTRGQTHYYKDRTGLRRPLSELHADNRRLKNNQSSQFFRKFSKPQGIPKSSMSNDNASRDSKRPIFKIAAIIVIIAGIFLSFSTFSAPQGTAFYDRFDMEKMMRDNPEKLGALLNALKVGE